MPAAKLSLCKNCLRIGHAVDGRILGPCKKYQLKHNSLLHLDITPDSSISSNPVMENSEPTHSTFLVNPSNAGESSYQILLSTVTFFVQNAYGEKIQCRAILDNGS